MEKLIHTMAALASLGEAVSDPGDPKEMIRTALHLLQGSVGVPKAGIAEYEPSALSLRWAAIRGFRDKPLSDVTLEASEVERLIQGGLEIIDVPERENPPAKVDPLMGILVGSGARLFIPLVIRNELFGAVILGEKMTEEPFSAEELDLILAMSRHIAVGIRTDHLLRELERKVIENRELYDGMRGIYKDTVKAFAAAIDCKDKYTQGHSERVGKYSEIIAREMGWDEEEVEGVAIAGYLHDIGKLVVEREIINAPYKIDAKRSNELNRHPSVGFEILSPINYPYANIPLTARSHHERPDGRGYPDGLTEENIPPGAKVVSVADSFDAMTTDRPYRRRRSLEEVIEDLRKNSGKQFAADAVVSLCRALIKEITGATKERRIIKMLGKDYVQPDRDLPLLKTLVSELGARQTRAASTS